MWRMESQFSAGEQKYKNSQPTRKRVKGKRSWLRVRNQTLAARKSKTVTQTTPKRDRGRKEISLAFEEKLGFDALITENVNASILHTTHMLFFNDI